MHCASKKYNVDKPDTNTHTTSYIHDQYIASFLGRSFLVLCD